jgi:hypothetical protein
MLAVELSQDDERFVGRTSAHVVDANADGHSMYR